MDSTIVRLDLDHPPASPWEMMYGTLERDPGGWRAPVNAECHLCFAGAGLTSVAVDARFTTESGAAPRVDSSAYSFWIGGAAAPTTAIRVDRIVVGATGSFRCAAGGTYRLRCERAGGRLRMIIDGAVIVDAPDPRPRDTLFDLSLALPQGVVLHDAVVDGVPSPEKLARLPRSERYDLYMAIDFGDDVSRHAWEEGNLRAAMQFYREKRIKRIYFIDHFGYHSGYWDLMGDAQREQRVRETYESIGDFLPAFTRAAHDAGLEAFALFKPYEGAFAHVLPHGTEEARRHGKVPRLEGMMWRAMGAIRENPGLRIERDMRSVPPDLDRRTVRTIVLKGEERLKTVLDLSRLRLWVSPDNNGYRPYAGPITIAADSGAPNRIVLSGLELREKFFALTVEGDPTFSFGNGIFALVEVRDAAGEMLPISFAVVERRNQRPIEEIVFSFNHPTDSVHSADEYVWLDSGKPLGLALGYERYLDGTPCEAYDEVQAWWADEVRHYIAAGVDGIDFRIPNHTRVFDWDAYCFSPPLIEAFKAKHGIDITRQPFNRADMRRLRGEYYTQFLRNARQLLRQAGKALHVHVSPRETSPEWHTDTEVHFDWPRWIDEGLVDEITVKMMTMRGMFAPRLAARAREAGLKLNFCPYLNGLPRHPAGRDILRHLIHDAREGGADGFIIYENAYIMAAADGGAINVTAPWMFDDLSASARPM